jgi:sugar O-acyltransferase (sialic acid O-acetyltransferase NeuD family)
LSLPVIIVGAGGHATVVADALLASGQEVLGFTDRDSRLHGTRICGIPVLGDDSALARQSVENVRLANGVGGTRGEPLRREVQARLESQGWTFCGVRHPRAVVSAHARIGAGAHLMAGCIVQPGVVVGAGCIVNTGAILEHDVVLGDFVHVAPGAVVCGNARVGDHSHIGAGAVLLQGLSVGNESIVGAGAVVVTSHPGRVTLIGVPARPWNPAS